MHHEAKGNHLDQQLARERREEQPITCVDESCLCGASRVERRFPCESNAVEENEGKDGRIKSRVLNKLYSCLARLVMWSKAEERLAAVDVATWTHYFLGHLICIAI